MNTLRGTSYSRAELTSVVEARQPRCRKFVSRFWGVDDRLAAPEKVTVKEERFERAACVRDVERELILFAGNFRKDEAERVERALVHELTHLVSASFLDMSKNVNRCIAEGLALLATDVYMYEDCDCSGKDSIYFNGKRFIRSLLEGGIMPKTMHRLLRYRPTLNELFFPSRYLDRMGITHSMNRDSASMSAKEWVRIAMGAGRKALAFGVSDPSEMGWGFIEKQREHRDAYGMPRGVPRNLLHSPESYGAMFFLMLKRFLGGKQRVFDKVDEVPPEKVMEMRRTVSHIIEPHRYLVLPEIGWCGPRHKQYIQPAA